MARSATARRADNHYRIVDGDRLLISGRATLWETDPGRFAAELAADIARLYPQLGQVAIEHRWSGVLGRTIHGKPQIGTLSPGIWLASGDGGHGINTTAMAGNLIARAIVDGDDTWRLFRPFELIWAGGLTGRVAAQAGYWWSRRRDEARALQARRRAAGGQRAQPVQRRRAPAKNRTERAAPPEPPATVAMEVPAVALPADPQLDALPSEDPLAVDQRPARSAVKASRSNR